MITVKIIQYLLFDSLFLFPSFLPHHSVDLFELPQLDRKRTQNAIEETFEKYRILKVLLFEPPISEGTYYKLRWKAFYKLALILNLSVS